MNPVNELVNEAQNILTGLATKLEILKTEEPTEKPEEPKEREVVQLYIKDYVDLLNLPHNTDGEEGGHLENISDEVPNFGTDFLIYIDNHWEIMETVIDAIVTKFASLDNVDLYISIHWRDEASYRVHRYDYDKGLFDVECTEVMPKLPVNFNPFRFPR